MGFPELSMAVCGNCCIISEQEEAIEFLNDQIHELSNTLQTWRNIRSIENEIDVSYCQLNATTGNGGLSDPPHTDEAELQLPISGTEDAMPECDVLHEPIDNLTMDDDIENMLRQFRKMSVVENAEINTTTNSTSSDQQNSSPQYLSDVSSNSLNMSKSVNNITDNHSDDKNYITIDNASINNSLDLHLTDVTGECFSDLNDTDCVDREVSKFQPNDFVETVFAGDATIQKVHIGQEDVHPEKVFKIAKPQSDIKQLSETVEFFMDKLHKGAKSLIFQLGTTDFKGSNSEDIKRSILKLLDKMEQKGVQVVLSGPIPYPRMDNTTFSRMFAIHEWLINQELSHNVIYVNNVLSFWDKPKLFAKTGTRLSDSGNIILTKNISTCFLD